MRKKVLLILVDGMRPDALRGLPSAEKMASEGAYTDNAQTVFPSVTLPCHMSLYHSVDPERHGVTTNTYTPQVRPIRGLGEVLRAAGKSCSIYYGWEELKDLTRPDSLAVSVYRSGHIYGYEESNHYLADAAIRSLKEDNLDFAFLYLGFTDEAGHAEGWMGKEYLRSVASSWADIDRVRASLSEEWTCMVIADHGGHDRSHGTTMPEDMTIPFFAVGPDFAPGSHPENVSIKDIAPTIAAILGVAPDKDWEGKSLIG